MKREFLFNNKNTVKGGKTKEVITFEMNYLPDYENNPKFKMLQYVLSSAFGTKISEFQGRHKWVKGDKHYVLYQNLDKFTLSIVTTKSNNNCGCTKSKQGIFTEINKWYINNPIVNRLPDESLVDYMLRVGTAVADAIMDGSFVIGNVCKPETVAEEKARLKEEKKAAKEAEQKLIAEKREKRAIAKEVKIKSQQLTSNAPVISIVPKPVETKQFEQVEEKINPIIRKDVVFPEIGDNEVVLMDGKYYNNIRRGLTKAANEPWQNMNQIPWMLQDLMDGVQAHFTLGSK